MDTRNKLFFQMFKISLVQTGTVNQLHYLLMHVYNYYQLFAYPLASMLYQYTPV